MSFPDVQLPYLPPNTIVPETDLHRDFVQYLNRLYEDIAFAVNARDFNFFTVAIGSVAANIPNMNNFGAFLLCVSGEDTGLPTGVWALCKSDIYTSGTLGIAPLSSQVGTSGVWAGATLTVTSTATSPTTPSNFQINHSVTNTMGNFNIRIVGTQ